MAFLAKKVQDSKHEKVKATPYQGCSDSESEIFSALSRARDGKKRVLLQCGANWSSWCQRMKEAWETEPLLRDSLAKWFELVLVDIESEENASIAQRLADPAKFGVPVLVVLDNQGDYLTTQWSGAMEYGPVLMTESYDVTKLFNFLDYWKVGGQFDIKEIQAANNKKAFVRARRLSLLGNKASEDTSSPAKLH